MSDDTIEGRIAELVISSKAPRGDVGAKIRDLMLDTSGILIASAGTNFASLMAGSGLGRSGDVPLLSGGSADLMWAVLLNSSLGYCLDLDAVYNPATLHIAAALFPSLLTLAVHRDSDCREFMRAFNAGHDVAAAFGRALNPSGMYERNFHPSSVCDCVGCAVASSIFLGLDGKQLVSAMGIAMTRASGLTTVFDEEKHHAAPLQIGHAARCGVEAAILAGRGIAGPPMFGRKNIMDTFSAGQSAAKTEVLMEALEKGGSVMQTGFKRHSACKFLQTAIDAVMELREEGADFREVEEISLSIAPSTAPLVDNAGDLTHNAQLVLSAALIDGHVSSEQYATIRSREDVVKLSRRVKIVADGGLEHHYPQAMPAGVKLKNRDGRTMSRFVEYARGDPMDPLSTAELMAKFERLTTRSPEAAVMQRAIDLLPKTGGAKHVMEILCRREVGGI